jgi:hypothetical protein
MRALVPSNATSSDRESLHPTWKQNHTSILVVTYKVSATGDVPFIEVLIKGRGIIKHIPLT